MRGQLPDAILNRPKQAYRSPSVSYADSDYVKDLLSNEAIESAGLFNPDRVKKLSMKMNSGKNISEVDKMAFMGILSTQILNDLFVKKHKKALNKSELIDCKLTLLN